MSNNLSDAIFYADSTTHEEILRVNEYPVWWETTVTLYNKYVDPLTHNVSYIRRVLEGCFWDNAGSMVTVGNVQIQSNDVICRIRENALYKPKGQWQSMPNDSLSDYFTLGAGDILIRGEVDDVVDENARNHRASDLIAKYKDTQDCIVIKRFSDNTGAGRCMPHYYAIGE